MSYILDALRKADAQRERGASRSIHARAATLGTAQEAPLAGAPWIWVVLALVVVLGGAMAWYMVGDKAASTASVAAMTAPTTTPASTHVTAPASPQAPVVANVASTAAPAAPAIQPPPAAQAIVGAPAGRQPGPHEANNAAQAARRGAQPVPASMPNAMAPVRAADARNAAMMAGAQGSRPSPAPPQTMSQSMPQSMPQPQPSMGAGAAPGTPSNAPSNGAGMAGVPALTGGLPPDAPKLSISGGVYSANPAQRMLIVNGQVFNEGSELAPGVTLESIQPKTAVLKFRGGNYTVGY